MLIYKIVYRITLLDDKMLEETKYVKYDELGPMLEEALAHSAESLEILEMETVDLWVAS